MNKVLLLGIMTLLLVGTVHADDLELTIDVGGVVDDGASIMWFGGYNSYAQSMDTAQSGGGGGGGDSFDYGGEQGNEYGKSVCAITISPKTIEITDDQLNVEVNVINADRRHEYQPTISFRDTVGDSVSNRVEVAGGIKSLGTNEGDSVTVRYAMNELRYTKGLGEGFVIFTDSNCKKIEIPILLNIDLENEPFIPKIVGAVVASGPVNSVNNYLEDRLNNKISTFAFLCILFLLGLLYLILVANLEFSDVKSINFIAQLGSWVALMAVTMIFVIMIVRSI